MGICRYLLKLVSILFCSFVLLTVPFDHYFHWFIPTSSTPIWSIPIWSPPILSIPISSTVRFCLLPFRLLSHFIYSHFIYVPYYVKKSTEYFQNTWISGIFPLKTWNHYENIGPRTNNALGGWHGRINRFAVKPHPNIFLVHCTDKIWRKPS